MWFELKFSHFQIKNINNECRRLLFYKIISNETKLTLTSNTMIQIFSSIQGHTQFISIASYSISRFLLIHIYLILIIVINQFDFYLPFKMVITHCFHIFNLLFFINYKTNLFYLMLVELQFILLRYIHFCVLHFKLFIYNCMWCNMVA